MAPAEHFINPRDYSFLQRFIFVLGGSITIPESQEVEKTLFTKVDFSSF